MRLPDFAAAQAAGKLSFVDVAAYTLLRLTRSPKTEPYWGKDIKYCFDDPAATFGVTYAAQKLEVAFAETVLHEEGSFTDERWAIEQACVNERHIVHFDRTSGTFLRLVNLTGEKLKLLGLNNDLCASDDYTESMRVSAAIHNQVSDADGILYVSRQINTQFAMALFERSQVQCQPTSEPLTAHPNYPGLLEMFAVELLPSTATPP